MSLRPLLLALLMSAAAGAVGAQPADDPGLAGGPPPHHGDMDRGMDHDRMGPHGHGARECFRRSESDAPRAPGSGPESYGWRKVPCPPMHAMEGPPPPPMMDRDMPPPPPTAGVHSSTEYYEHGEYRSYDSGDRYGYGPPMPDMDEPPPPPGYGAGPPPGYEGPPPGYEGPPSDDRGPPPGYDGPPPGYEGPPPGYGPQGDGPPVDDDYLDWPGKNY